MDNGGRGRRRRRRLETKGNIGLHFFFFASNRAVYDEIRVDLLFFLFREITCFFFPIDFFFCGLACYYHFFAKENSFVGVLGSGVKPQKALTLGKKLL